jgi:hypothetical protein
MLKVASTCILMVNATTTASSVAEHASNIRGGIELPLILGNVAVL